MADDAALTGDEWTLASFTAAIHRGGVGLWAWSPTRRIAQLDGLCREFWHTAETTVGIDDLFARVNPEDRDEMMLDWAASATDPHAYSFDSRIGDGPEARWISARGVGGEAGRMGEWVQAIFLDITERKRAEDAERLLAAELAHRVSNMFTVARALTAIVAREAKSTPHFAAALSQRFGVLHEATALATRSHRSAHGTVNLQSLAERILSPYLQGADIAVDIEASIAIGADHVNDYAMVFHELATNSAKYGALSRDGTLKLTGRLDESGLRIVWRETSATSEAPKSDGTGFGSRLLKQTIERSLWGRFSRVIDEAGLNFEMLVPVGAMPE